MKNILKALFEAKKEIAPIVKDSKNPFFNSKYFDINSLLENVEPILHKHGLIVLQPILETKVTTTIYHVESGEHFISGIELPNITDPQKLGSAITYYRRYTLQSLLSLQAEDDDANTASKASQPKTELQWLNRTDKSGNVLPGYLDIIQRAKKQGFEVSDIKKYYRISKEVEVELEKDLQS